MRFKGIIVYITEGQQQNGVINVTANQYDGIWRIRAKSLRGLCRENIGYRE
jgi:hypothetical protein